MEQPSDRERLMKQIIKYKDKDGEDQEITVGGALKEQTKKIFGKN